MRHNIFIKGLLIFTSIGFMTLHSTVAQQNTLWLPPGTHPSLITHSEDIEVIELTQACLFDMVQFESPSVCNADYHEDIFSEKIVEDSLVMALEDEELFCNTYLKKETLRKSMLNNALEHFRNGRWQEARIILNKYVQKYENPREDYLIAVFHLAKSCLNMGDYTVAASIYNKFLSFKPVDNESQTKAKWDRAMSYLYVDYNKAKTYFKEIANDYGNELHDDAKGFLGSL